MDLSDIAASVLHDMQPHFGRGRVADYIPALARVDPGQFGLAIVTGEGEMAVAGDADVAFSVQSISKVFTLTLALEKLGADLWKRVGREPSGSAFNSIVQLERERGVPRNPLINPGALVVADTLLEGGDPAATIDRIVSFVRRAADDPGIGIDPEVAASEADTGFRNASLANFLRAEGNLLSPVSDVLRVYFNQCALSLTCRQLARSALYLAAGEGGTMVQTVNGLLDQMAQLNGEIRASTAAGDTANTYSDQRDEIIDQLLAVSVGQQRDSGKTARRSWYP